MSSSSSLLFLAFEVGRRESDWGTDTDGRRKERFFITDKSEKRRDIVCFRQRSEEQFLDIQDLEQNILHSTHTVLHKRKISERRRPT